MSRLTPLVLNAALPGSPIFTSREVAAWTGSLPAVASRKLARLEREGVVTRLTRGVWAVTSHPRFSPYAVVPYLLTPTEGTADGAADGAPDANAEGWDVPIDLGDLDGGAPDGGDADDTPVGGAADGANGYVSFVSALHLHGMLSQIPREVHVAVREQRPEVRTPVATYVFHQLGPALFGGAVPGDDWDRFRIATPAKALVDTLYVSVSRGRRFGHLPELDLPYERSPFAALGGAPGSSGGPPGAAYPLRASEARLAALDAEVRRWVARIESLRARTAVARRWEELRPTLLTHALGA